MSQKYSASASATGYLYQCRYALLAGLQAIKSKPELQISIEKFDDIAFETGGIPVELVQTKHHIGKQGSLTDTSVDLWKTLRIWCELVGTDVEAPFRTSFVLLTTASAPDGSAASYLRPSERDETKADQALQVAATKSTNDELKVAFAAYLALPSELRLSMLRAIQVLDQAANIGDVRDDIASEVYHAAPRDRVDQFVERLEGWWFGVVIKALSGSGQDVVPVLAIDQRVDELREEFKRNSLPVDFRSAKPTPEVVAELDQRPFVQQLRKVSIGAARVEYAIRDYYRASEQRSRWAREELLLDGELDLYERELKEAWEPRFAAMQDALTPQCSAETRISFGQSLFAWAEQEASFPFRTVRDRFLTHGSYHILANRYVVGWHPDYAEDGPEGEE